ncbi:MAG TPA: N-acetyltransferase [Pyrinomonadaceae bacterium]|nr:N-acetyltransferase [Pyrinomonadaceae bacterium]
MITIRAEAAEDIPAVHRVNRLAFEQAAEAELVDSLREAAHPYISLVAVSDGQVVGHIFFSPVTLEPEVAGLVLMGLAPMAVLPERQNQGIGSMLVLEGLEECRRIGCDAVVVLGHPEYYPRFGFVRASLKGLRCEFPAPDGAFMVRELRPDALGAGGLVKYRPEFSSV